MAVSRRGLLTTTAAVGVGVVGGCGRSQHASSAAVDRVAQRSTWCPAQGPLRRVTPPV